MANATRLPKIPTNRRPSGNMLILTLVVLGFVALIIVAGMSFNFFQIGYEKAEEVCDRLAVTDATALNSGDRIGQMNNAIARSRELVFNLRTAYHLTQSGHANLEPLAKSFLARARANATHMDAERHSLIQTCLDEIKESVKKTQESEKSSVGLSTFGIKTQTPKINTVTVGYLDKVDSNVKGPEGNDQLMLYDLNQGFVKANTKLYAANTNLNLPGEDSDLPFQLSSLPAPIKGTISQARLLKEQNFKKLATVIKNGMPTDATCSSLPSALQLQMAMDVETGANKKDKNTASTNSIAATVGASPAP